jgi:hypothetical protein
MQCPDCGEELAEQARCQNCSSGATSDTSPHVAPENEAVRLSDPIPPPHVEEPSQAADSSDTPLTAVPPEPPQDRSPKAVDAVNDASQTKAKDTALNREGNLEVIKRLSERLDCFLSDMAPASSPASEPERRMRQILESQIFGSTLTAGGSITFNLGASEGTTSSKSADEKSLHDLVRNLPSRTLEHYLPSHNEVLDFAQRLREHRVLLITSAFTEHTLDAAYAVIRSLSGIPEIRYLTIDIAKNKNIDFGIQSLLERRADGQGESVVLVDALSTLARTFPDSILRNPAWAASIKDDLRDRGQFLVVIIDLDYAEQKKLSREHFPYWEVPFLRPFLKRHYPGEYVQLESEIIAQQELGRWEPNPILFAEEVMDYFHRGQLRAVVSGGGPKDPESSAAKMLDASDQIEKTVLYTAAFFRDITAPELCRVVAALLGKRTMQVSAALNQTNGGDSGSRMVSEVPLTQIWEDSKDHIFHRFLRETSAGNDALRVVGFSESSMREPLRRLFEKRHSLYLIDQFRNLQESGIFFHPSLRLAQNTTRIAVEIARLYPDEFNESWIIGLVLRLREHLLSDLADASGDPMFRFLQGPQSVIVNTALARVADVCRRMLPSPQQKTVVQNSLDQLMKSGYHEEVLWLIKQLRFSPDFDELFWIKQLLNRADLRTRRLTFYYLLSYLKRLRKDVYDGLMKIEMWLPPTDRESFSPFDTFVFQLLIQYCLETVGRFEARHYGKWPSRYPLFAIKDGTIAEARTSLLARWLLHPGIEVTLSSLRIGGTQMTLIGALLAEWSFILLGDKTTHRFESPEYSAASLFKLLFRQFASRTDLSQRLELLKFWNLLEHDLLAAAAEFSVSNTSRQELQWKRLLVRELIKELKAVPRPEKVVPQIHQLPNFQQQL